MTFFKLEIYVFSWIHALLLIRYTTKWYVNLKLIQLNKDNPYTMEPFPISVKTKVNSIDTAPTIVAISARNAVSIYTSHCKTTKQFLLFMTKKIYA